MKLNRRGFLASLTGTVVAGPSAAKEALAHPGMLGTAMDGVRTAKQRTDVFYPEEEGRESLLKRLARWGDPAWRERKFREHSVYALDPDLYALRSVSLGSKIAIQKKRNFAEYERSNKSWIERRLLGEDDD